MSFGDDYQDAFSKQSSLDLFLNTDKTPRLASLTESKGLRGPVKAGTRVCMVPGLRAMLAYTSPPDPGVAGTVVLVKTSSGNMTESQGRVFVAWDDGKFRAIHQSHLCPANTGRKLASNVSQKVASVGDLSEMFSVSRKASDELIHKATKDLWSFRKGTDGFVIERLFDDTGKPLKG